MAYGQNLEIKWYKGNTQIAGAIKVTETCPHTIIGKTAIPVDPIDFTTYCKNNLYYTGSTQILVNTPPANVTFINNTGKDAKTYQVKAHINEPQYVWSDATTGDKSFNCSIAPGPAGLNVGGTTGSTSFGTNKVLNANTNSDGAITCTTSDANVAKCTVDCKKITIIPQAVNGDNKTATLTITQAATSNYVSETITYTITVNRKTLTCPSSPSEQVFIGKTIESGVTCPSGSTAGGTQSAISVGTYAHTCTATNGYKFASACSVAWKITQKKATITLSKTSGSLTYGTNDTVTITADGDGAITCTSTDTGVAKCSVSGKTLTITPQAVNGDNKTATITVKQAAGTNYSAADDKTYAATVSRILLTCPNKPADIVYDAKEHNSGVTCPTGSTAGGTQKATDANKYYHTCSPTNGYKFASTCSVEWKINKSASSITCVNRDFTGGAQTLYSASNGCSPKDHISETNANTYTVTCTGDSNHSDSSCSATIRKVNAVITCTNPSYTGRNLTIATCVGGNISNQTRIDAGSQEVTCTGDGNHNTVKQSCSVAKVDAVITCTNPSYTGENLTIATCVGGNISNQIRKVAGSQEVTCTGDKNHNTVKQSCSVAKADAVITCTNPSYTGENLTIATCVGGNISGHTRIDAGSQEVTCSGDSNHNTVKKSCSVAKVDAVITCTNPSYTGGNLTIATCVGGNLSGHTRIDAGSQEVTCTGDKNHNTVKKSCSVEKTPAVLTCSNKTYNGTNQTGCSCSGGTIGGTYSATNTGTYEASCSPDKNHTAPAKKSWKIIVNCGAGKYLPANSQTCSNCPDGSYCEGTGDITSSTSDQGKKSCPTDYTKSDGARSAQSDCYKPGTKKDCVGHTVKSRCSSDEQTVQAGWVTADWVPNYYKPEETVHDTKCLEKWAVICNGANLSQYGSCTQYSHSTCYCDDYKDCSDPNRRNWAMQRTATYDELKLEYNPPNCDCRRVVPLSDVDCKTYYGSNKCV